MSCSNQECSELREQLARQEEELAAFRAQVQEANAHREMAESGLAAFGVQNIELFAEH
jgi:hypothetical protein